jgi:hypothetical protein
MGKASVQAWVLPLLEAVIRRGVARSRLGYGGRDGRRFSSSSKSPDGPISSDRSPVGAERDIVRR